MQNELPWDKSPDVDKNWHLTASCAAPSAGTYGWRYRLEFPFTDGNVIVHGWPVFGGSVDTSLETALRFRNTPGQSVKQVNWQQDCAGGPMTVEFSCWTIGLHGWEQLGFYPGDGHQNGSSVRWARVGADGTWSIYAQLTNMNHVFPSYLRWRAQIGKPRG